MKQTIRLFSRFEIFWHWSQAVLIFAMLITGFELHGSYGLLGYGLSASVHVACAVALMLVWVFAVFWHFATGEWRQYVPTTRKLAAVAEFYARGIFKGEEHPFRPSRVRKHNPIQLVAYLIYNVIVSPAIWITGLLYLAYSMIGVAPWPPLSAVAFVHVAAAYATVVFVIGHVYMITTGETVFQHLKAMLTGFEAVEVAPEDTAGSARAGDRES